MAIDVVKTKDAINEYTIALVKNAQNERTVEVAFFNSTNENDLLRYVIENDPDDVLIERDDLIKVSRTSLLYLIDEVNKVRNERRIDRVLSLIGLIWKYNSDLRFNELITKLNYEYAVKNGLLQSQYIKTENKFGITFEEKEAFDLFYIEDEEFEKFLNLTLDKYEF